VRTTRVDPAFEDLLRFVRENRGFDYAAYKRPSLMRRFGRRLESLGIDSYEDYRHYLEAEPREYAELFNTILINVTSFFRDPAAWEALKSRIFPRIVESKSDKEPIRVWSAGCASGEEAYSAAILLAEAVGEEDYRRRVKLYATDIDEEALTEARHGAYQPKKVQSVPEELLEKYFQETDGRFVVRNDLRRGVIFGRNDLLTDPPISRVDLLISRNTLMYFGAPAQMRILSNFAFALNSKGYLFLGKAEAFQNSSDLFEALDLKNRVFVPTGVESRPRQRAEPDAEDPALLATDSPIRNAGFDLSPVAQLMVDLDGVLVLANQQARSLLGIGQSDVGRRLRDLEVSYKPLEVRSRIEQALDERRSISVRDVVWTVDGGERHYDVQISPLTGAGGETIGVTIAWLDVSRYQSLRAELEQTKRDLETAYEELQSAVEELETTNEELQSTNEELETTNEELQSTNEELETMNEELQSTNEELETMNDELRERTDEALQANTFFTSILASIEQSVIVIDPELRVTAWSDAAADLWGLRSDEVEGQFFLNLDIGLPLDELRKPIRSAIAGEPVEDVALEAHNRRGQQIRCTVSFSHLADVQGEGKGVILVMTAESRPAE